MYSVVRNSEFMSPNLSPVSTRFRLVFGLNVNEGIGVAIDGPLNQSVQIAIQMHPGTCGDVSAYDLIRMTQVWHVILGRMLPRYPNYVIARKC